MKELFFDELLPFFETIPQPAQRLGVFRVKINNWHKRYDFHNLKITASNNPDLFGFSLNHYGWLNLPMPKYKNSKFHDNEDVSIDISRDDFKNAQYFDSKIPEVVIFTKTSRFKITWEI